MKARWACKLLFTKKQAKEKRSWSVRRNPIHSLCVSHGYEPMPRLFRTRITLLCENDVALASPMTALPPHSGMHSNTEKNLQCFVFLNALFLFRQNRRLDYRNVLIIGSAEALPLCVRYFGWERERERDTERERRKWRHHCRAKIGDEFTLSLAKNSHNWQWAYIFPCQKFALFVSPFTDRSPLWRWSSQWAHTFHCQKLFRPLCSPSFQWHDEWSKTQDKWSNPAQSYFVLPIEKMNQINTKNYWKWKEIVR